MRRQRVLILGGTGLVGRFVVENCLAGGYDVSVMGRTPPAAGMFSNDIDFRPGILDPDARPDRLFDGVSYVVHAAFQHAPGKYRGGEGDDPHGFWRANVDGSVALLEAAKRACVKRFVFLSSRAAYPPVAPGVILDEIMVGEPASFYGKTKLVVEQKLAQLREDGFLGISLRITGVYGAHRLGARHKWEQLFDDYLCGRKIIPRAATEVHGEDVASAVGLMLELPEEKIEHNLYNVSDMVLDLHDLLAIVKDGTGSHVPLPVRSEAGGINAMKTERLRKLGWVPGGENRLRERVMALISS
ncbi:NAD-dependent epimerase/dehydratase family protein [Limoniibacter endophyticus]|uniref:UDP-glucose 4-epimerase n=1 Tax=Limoniibacter endophyticus TaxID=1565040 RepID=A0A8J3GG06_9HYPH|nr:NAD(P)-dependent oxidoreductase [Limoniibacter endophyticus]GHC65813.1 UDP-glucose 4-epimerase [Limoniibacter endophyticus]